METAGWYELQLQCLLEDTTVETTYHCAIFGSVPEKVLWRWNLQVGMNDDFGGLDGRMLLYSDGTDWFKIRFYSSDGPVNYFPIANDVYNILSIKYIGEAA